MHEWGLVAAAAGDVTGRSAGRAPRSVRLRLGPGADAATVRAAWAAITAGGPLSGTELVIAHQQDRLQCLGCGEAYPGQLPDACPRCGSDGLVTSAAADLAVDAVVMDDVDDQRPCA